MANDSRYHLKLSPKTKFLNLIRILFIYTGTDKLIAKMVRHKSPESLLSKLTPPNYLYKSGTVRNFTIDGIRFSLDISDTVGHSNYFAIADAGHNTLYSLVKPGITIFDIGANVGSTTLNFAKLTGASGNVISFEPDARNHSAAKKNISLNSFTNIRLFNNALGDVRSEAMQYNVNEKNRGMMRIAPSGLEPGEFEGSAVQIETLDSILEKEKLPPPQLMKLDVEGYELKVLKGGNLTLLVHKPTLFIELDDNNLREQGNSASELVAYLENMGYKVKNAADNEPLDKDSDFKNCHIDIVCST